MSTEIWSLLIALATFMGPKQVQALEFRHNPAAGVIEATGQVELGDAEKIEKLLTLDFRQGIHNVRGLVPVTFDSPGGSLLGGLRLGYALRRLGVHSNVGPNQVCHSACAFAFLGGLERTVSGEYGLHAASIRTKIGPGDVAGVLDTVQYLGAVTTSYVQAMTGRSDVAIRALATSAAKIDVLDDAKLVSMRVITQASRPSQFGKTGFKCPAEQDLSVLSAICTHLDIAALDQELNDLFGKIRREVATRELEQDQERWRRYRNSCINDDEPNGYESVVGCIREAYLVRRDQLTSIWLAISAKKSVPGARNWRPLEAR